MLKRIWLKTKESFDTAGTTAIVVIVIVLVVWGAVTVVPKAISGLYDFLTASLSSTFIPSKEITISSDSKNVESGSIVNILINDENASSGTLYTLYYPCTNNVSVLLNGANGTSSAMINCGEDFYLLNKNGSFSLTMNSDKLRYVSVPLTVKSQNDKGELEKIGSVSIGVTNQKIGQISDISPVKVATTTIVTPSTVNTPVYYYGNPDLSINISSVDTTNMYNTSAQNQVLVKFEVKNIGTNQTGLWKFSATLPSSSMPNYVSELQRNLNPGDKMQFTLGFNNIDTTNSPLIKIIADSSNEVIESNELNNSASYNLIYNNQTITTNTGNNNYYYSNNNYNGTGNYLNLSGSCYGNSAAGPYGNSISWTANASGGNGSYTYLWSSNDGLYGYSQNITQTYSSVGLKYANVKITSGGQTITAACTASTYSNNGTYYNTQSDLGVILETVGTIDSYGRFVQTGQILKGSTAAAKILVVNNGAFASGPWSLVSSFAPSYPTNSFQIVNQASLAPGERREVIITFLNVQQIGDNNFGVVVDPNNQNNDSNRGNNSLTALLRVY